jgi:hypothetical protein
MESRESPPATQRLGSGLPAETFIQAGERAVLSCLIHPLVEQIDLAFRED